MNRSSSYLMRICARLSLPFVLLALAILMIPLVSLEARGPAQSEQGAAQQNSAEMQVDQHPSPVTLSVVVKGEMGGGGVQMSQIGGPGWHLLLATRD